MSGLNEPQRRHLVVGYRHLDRSLSEASRILARADAESPFPKYVADASPIQIRLLEDILSRFRTALVRALDELGVAPDPPQVSAVWSFRTALVSAKVTLDELDERYLQRYGSLSEDDRSSLREVLSELRDLLREMTRVAEERPGEDLEQRLEKLESTRGEMQLLRELGRRITIHGLFELRSTLSLLLERVESKSFDVALFGRVSSGKSSLLNHLLGTNILPVGVTPVTAVPIRIAYEETPRLRVCFASRPTLSTTLSRLREFASEEGNPSNAKRVISISAELPASCLKSGVVLVDTPGLGSLTPSGAAETSAYLPRCDLGIVLVDASSTLDRDDLDLVRALRKGGTTVMVLLSKADLLTRTELRVVAEYVEHHLFSETGFRCPVHPVSVVGARAELAARWFERALLPVFASKRQHAEDSIRRRVVALRDATVGALRTRLGRPRMTRGASPPHLETEPTEKLLRRQSGRIELARRECREILAALEDEAPGIHKEATERIVRRLQENPSRLTVSEILQSVWNRHTSEVGGRVFHTLTRLSQELEGSGIEELRPPDGLPRPDALRMPAAVDVKPQRWGIRFGPYLRSRVSSELSDVDSFLQEALSSYRKEVFEWSERILDELQRAVDRAVDRCRSVFSGPPSPPKGTSTGDTEAIEKDLELLARWEVPGSEEKPSFDALRRP